MRVTPKMKSRFVVLLAFLLVFTSFTGFVAGAESNQGMVQSASMKVDLAEIATAKIDSEVTNAFSKNEYVEVLIELTEQVDTEKVAAEAVQILSKNATPYQEKMASRFAVVEALKSTAESSQKELLDYLGSLQDKGLVEDYKSFYIMNMVYVKASQDAIKDLAYRYEIKAITLDEKIEVDWPEVTVAMNTADNQVLDNSLQNIEWNIDRIGASTVWDTYGITGTGVTVGIIDSGVHWTHEALQAKYRGYNPNGSPTHNGNWLDAVNGQSDPYDIPSIPHGSHVMGTILGQDPSGQNKIGVAPGSKWIAAKAFTADGGQQSWLLAAGEFMLAPNNDPTLAPDVVNNSWGGGAGLNEWYRPMVQAWRAAGILPVFSAGNSGPGAGTVGTPSNYPESVSVASTDINNDLASSSSRGPGPYPGDLKPDISAPGVNIRSSVPTGYESAGWTGTSMAAPHITGTAALLLETNAALSVDELEEIIFETSTPLTNSQYTESPNVGFGRGLVNAFDAVSSIISGRGIITGSVLSEGSDNTGPEITHTPFDSAFAGFDIPVSATITDDVAVTNAELWVKNANMSYWAVMPMNRDSGDHKEGVYSAVIPWMFIVEPGFQYQIKALDYGRNHASTPLYNVEVEFGIVPGEYDTDFSQYPIGWSFGGDWSWGAPTVGPSPRAGDKLIATNPFGNYSNNSNSQMLMPPLDLRNATEASLRFNQWYDIENNFDNGLIAITSDYGENWDIVTQFTGRDQQWRSQVIDLNSYVGSQEPVFVLFGFFSDGSVVFPGWYIDNVELVGVDTVPPAAPTNLEATSSSVGVQLSWTAPTDPDLAGYNVYRSSTAGSNFELIGSPSNAQYVDIDVVAGTEYVYVVTARDLSNNESGYSNEATATVAEVEVVYSSDFEADNGGWTTSGTNNTWEWGVPTSGPNGAHSGDKLWATNLAGNYSNGTTSWIESPVLDLTGLSMAELSFAHWYNFENNYDFGYVQISTDDGNAWTDLVPRYTNLKQSWSIETISLTNYVDQEVKIRFLMTSDNSVARPGWYIDDIVVVGVGEGSDSATIQQPTVIVHPEVDLSKEKPQEMILETLRKDPEAYNYTLKNGISILGSNGLPVDGVVTVVETGRSVRTNPAEGTYQLMHAAGEYTLLVESYGYYTQTRTVEITTDEEITENFRLEAIPRGTVTGTIVDLRTGEPIEGATVRLIEDPKIPATVTDPTGSFGLSNVLEGSYTLQVSAANYHLADMNITVQGNQDTIINIELRPFIGYEDNIVYDDGIAENARAYFDAGNGWAVRMTPNGSAQVKGASVYLWGNDWPDPGANAFSVAIYDSLPNGEPGQQVVAPVVVEGIRGGWNYVDLSEFGYVTNKDFYVVMVQVGAHPNTPGMGMDESSSTGRSYMMVSGAFQQAPADYGNIMIRATVAYELAAPVITSPTNDTYTNQDTTTVTGTVTADSLVTIYVNDDPGATTQSENKAFSVEVDLAEGVNVITATAKIDAGETDPSLPITVIKDTVLPQVELTTPEEGTITNREVITVSGIATDEYLSHVEVNGLRVELQEDGSFSTRVIVNEGDNLIRVEAFDLAGNSTVEERTVTVDTVPPTITDITPNTDRTVMAGDTVEVTFRSDSTGGSASFAVVLPHTAQVTTSSSGIVMEEVEPGFYRGVWVVPEGLQVSDASIVIEMYDLAGNRSVATAPGKITVVSSPSDPGKPGKPKNPKDPGKSK